MGRDVGRTATRDRGALLDAALDYASQAIAVLPLHSVDAKGRCSCGRKGCANPGKHPRTRQGVSDATTDEVQIRRWWKRWPKANIGGCGIEHVCVDVDPRDDGDKALRALEEEHGELPRGAEVRTGRYGGKRGRHIWLLANGETITSSSPRAGIQIKATNGYAVLPPSRHASGVTYEWARKPRFDPAPDWLLRVAANGSAPDSEQVDPNRLTHLPLSKFTLEAIEHGLLETKDGEPQRTSAIGVCRNLRESGVPKELALVMMRNALLADGASFDEGRPWDERDIRKIVAEVYKGPAPDQAEHLKADRPFRLKVLGLAEAAEVAKQEIDWVIPDLLAAGEKAVIAGPPKSLKTWFALHVVRAVALGEAVLDEKPWTVQEPQPVLIVEEEGTHQRFAQRLLATFDGALDAPLTYSHRGGFSLLDRRHVRWVIDQTRSANARLIVIDPLQRVTPGIKENDATETAPAWDAVHEIASETGAAVVVIHHARKGGGEPSMDSIRGSSRIAGEVDLILVLRKDDRGTLECFIDGRELTRPDAEAGTLEIKYEPDEPHRMRLGGVRLNIKGAVNKTRPAVEKALQEASEPLTTAEVQAQVEERLGQGRHRSGISRELQEIVAEGLAVKTSKGKASCWEWAR